MNTVFELIHRSVDNRQSSLLHMNVYLLLRNDGIVHDFTRQNCSRFTLISSMSIVYSRFICFQHSVRNIQNKLIGYTFNILCAFHTHQYTQFCFCTFVTVFRVKYTMQTILKLLTQWPITFSLKNTFDLLNICLFSVRWNPLIVKSKW